jgi:hypothetical protein
MWYGAAIVGGSKFSDLTGPLAARGGQRVSLFWRYPWGKNRVYRLIVYTMVWTEEIYAS